MITKDDIEYPGGEKILGKNISIGSNIFSTSDFTPEYEKYSVNVRVSQYEVIESLTGEEFTSNYKVSEEVTNIKADDWVQVIQPVPEDRINTSVGLMLVVVNNKRLLIYLNCDYFELDKNFWSENDMDVTIYDKDVYGDGYYHVNYHNNEAEMVPEDDRIILLMVNGGFVPYSDIKVINNHIFVPLVTFSELLGTQAKWDENKETITIMEGDVKISLKINNKEASLNDEIKELDEAPAMFEGKIYVPVRFVAEALSADVSYVSNNYSDRGQRVGENIRTVSFVTIERPDKNLNGYSIDEGLVKVKEASEEEYKILLNYLKVSNRNFDADFTDYDAKDIVFTNEIYGRYYVYSLFGFPHFKIFFNKFTGEIYSEHAGLPFVNISKGFINISWLYQ